MHEKLFANLARGHKVSRVWPCYIAFGAISFGFLSIPSSGMALAIIPMFIMSGLIILYGTFFCFRIGKTDAARRWACIGMALMIIAAWSRAISLWGVDQQGAGSNFIATVVWLWITAGCLLLLITVWIRGLE